jgi:TRAP-type C4-dicarboxylate transport system permease small subunit
VDVVIRWVSHGSIKGVYELVEIAMAASVFSAFSYTQIKHSHVHVTLLIQYFPQKLKMFSYAFTSLITTVVMFAIAYAALTQSQASAAQNQMTSVLSIPLYPFYIFEAIAMCFFGLVLLYDTLRCFVAVFNKGLADEIQSTWS